MGLLPVRGHDRKPSTAAYTPLSSNHPPAPRSRIRRTPACLLTIAFMVCGILLLLLSLSTCSIFVHGACYKKYQSRFSFDAEHAHYPAWMADLPDNANITGLSIPGTHDTMTYGLLADNEVLQCQNNNLSTQLHAGVRYFDIRARLRDEELAIYHGDGDTGFVFADVLLDMFTFLDANPSETIIMRLKEEARPINQGTRTFEDAFNYYRTDHPLTSAGAALHLHLYNRTTPIPTLGELRSKIFILQQFDDPTGGPYGMAWDGPQMALEDYWIVPDIYHLAEKWTAIRDALEMAALAAPHDNDLLYLAHLSASVGVLPIEAAAGPLNRTVSGMNDMTGQWLIDFEHDEEVSRTGIVIIDFPGKELIDIILRWNKLLLKQETDTKLDTDVVGA